MSKYTKEDIIRMVEEEGVDFIRMQFTDIFWLRPKTWPSPPPRSKRP